MGRSELTGISDERAKEIALMLQERTFNNAGLRAYMVLLQSAAEDLGIPDQEMRAFCGYIADLSFTNRTPASAEEAHV